jgi:hypothetical protein
MARLASREGSPLWAGSLSASHAPAVHRAAVSLVQGGEPSWRSQLLALSMPRSVVVGERSLPQPALTCLRKMVWPCMCWLTLAMP